MNDVSDMLEQTARGSPSPPPASGAGEGKKMAKPKGMSREVFALISANSDAAAAVFEDIPLSQKTSGRKFTINPDMKTRNWQWEGFNNSGRSDGFRLKHWMRKPIVIDEYPFSRFNKPVYVVSYTLNQYEECFASSDENEGWSKEETDVLIDLCRRYDCRWPLLADRWPQNLKPRTSVDLKARYYHIAKILVKQYTEEQLLGGKPVEQRMVKLTAEARGAIKQYIMDEEEERERSILLDLQFKRTQEGDMEVARLQSEIQKLDGDIRKLKADRKRKLEEKTKLEKKKKKKKSHKSVTTSTTEESQQIVPVSGKPSSAKKQRIDLTVDDLQQCLQCLVAPTLMEGPHLRRSEICLPLRLEDDPIPQVEGMTEVADAPIPRILELKPPLSVGQSKSLSQLLANRVDDPPVCTAAVCEEYLAYRQDAIRLVVYETSVKKKKNELRSVRKDLKAAASPTS